MLNFPRTLECRLISLKQQARVALINQPFPDTKEGTIIEQTENTFDLVW